MPERRIPTERRDWRQIQERIQRFFSDLPADHLEIGYALARVPYEKTTTTQQFLGLIGTTYGEEISRTVFRQLDAMRIELQLEDERFHGSVVAVMEGRKLQGVPGGGAVNSVRQLFRA